MKLTQNRLLEKLLVMNRHFSPKKSADDIEIIAGDYFESLQHLDELDFIDSLRLYRERGKFFPLISDILECYAEVKAERLRNQKDVKALPYVSDTQRSENIKRLRALKDRIAKKRKIPF